MVANVIFTCGFAAQRSTFALLPMSLLSQPRSRKTQNLAQNAQGASEQLPVPSRALVDVPPVVSSDPSVQEFTILIRPSKNKRCRERPRGGTDRRTTPPPSKYPDLLPSTPQRDEHLSPPGQREEAAQQPAQAPWQPGAARAPGRPLRPAPACRSTAEVPETLANKPSRIPTQACRGNEKLGKGGKMVSIP